FLQHAQGAVIFGALLRLRERRAVPPVRREVMRDGRLGARLRCGRRVPVQREIGAVARARDEDAVGEAAFARHDAVAQLAASNPSAAPAWLQAMTGARVVSGAAVEAHGITHDSRQVSPGDIFVAIPGASADGNAFIEAALEAGAAAVIVEAGLRSRWHDELD